MCSTNDHHAASNLANVVAAKTYHHREANAAAVASRVISSRGLQTKGEHRPRSFGEGTEDDIDTGYGGGNRHARMRHARVDVRTGLQALDGGRWCAVNVAARWCWRRRTQAQETAACAERGRIIGIAIR